MIVHLLYTDKQVPTMTIPWPGCIRHNYFNTAVGSVICSFPFFTIVVTYIVGILFIKLKSMFK